MRPFTIVNIAFAVLLIAVDVLYMYGIAEWWWILVLVIIYLHALILGAIYIRWNFYLKSYHKGNDAKLVALSFDDGPATETARILDILRDMQVSAVFFIIGERAAGSPELIKRMHNEGHIIGNHSYKHGFHFDWMSAAKMAKEITQTNRLVKSIAGAEPRLFRPPYGVTNPNVAKAVKMTAMSSIGWSIRSFDTKAKDSIELKKRILKQLQGGDIILLHDSMSVTAEILTDLIVQARQKGFTFARVDKLLDISAYA